MECDNPKNRNNQFYIVRDAGGLVSIWLPPVSSQEGEKIATIHGDYIPSLIAALKRFEQVEGR